MRDDPNRVAPPDEQEDTRRVWLYVSIKERIDLVHEYMTNLYALDEVVAIDLWEVAFTENEFDVLGAINTIGRHMCRVQQHLWVYE